MATSSSCSTSSTFEERGKKSENYRLLRNAVKHVVEDEEFSLPTPPAIAARSCAERYLDYMDTNILSASKFSDFLVEKLKGCFFTSRSARVAREKMWEKYYKLCSSDCFRGRWVAEIGTGATLVFFQFVTDHVMEKLIAEELRVASPATTPATVSTVALDSSEINALRYVAGYVVKHLKDKLVKSTSVSKEMILCLTEMEVDVGSECHWSDQWTDLIDRGGLTHVSDEVFYFFEAVEVVTRTVLQLGRSDDNIKKELKKKIEEDDDVEHAWEIVAVNWEKETSDVLFSAMIDQWITIRGYSHASSLMEKYKQEHMTTVQKLKGLRLKINSTPRD